MYRGVVLIGILITLLVTTGCNVDDNKSGTIIYNSEQELIGEWTKQEPPQETKYKLITEENKQKVLTTYSDDEAKPYYQKIKELDLTKKVAVLAYLGPMPTGGYGIQINKVIQKNNQLIAEIKYISPQPDDMVTMAVTYPYDLVTLKIDKLSVEESSKLDLVIVEENNVK
ncbi:protease complex subunit PrcB family protein [Acetohalobium arabaticum]|uniref:PrcB C-terminal domain-containing protein n=1 Tax=Acetohalobium arabaticum (strain ATCC 49924 / DSM 5501 / Z-7288) TaxID=574087 RepID=D9QQ50_ACEAZ|nr:protease complex subunit PrcB family protein [Acetohalobium arabaticum]ADL12641.1 hypothetical protein Acear_1119 [Acetohalobium arabaticum DSM 5501]